MIWWIIFSIGIVVGIIIGVLAACFIIADGTKLIIWYDGSTTPPGDMKDFVERKMTDV